MTFRVSSRRSTACSRSVVRRRVRRSTPAPPVSGRPRCRRRQHAGIRRRSRARKLLELRAAGRRAGLLPARRRSPRYLASRSSQIRQDLVTAAEMRAAATAQLAEIDKRMQALPGGARGAEAPGRRRRQGGAGADRADRRRGTDAAARTDAARDRHAAADRAARADRARRARSRCDVAEQRIRRTITPDDQMRLVDRYATQLAAPAAPPRGRPMTSRGAATRYARALFDVARKEGDIQQAGRDLAAFARLVAGQRGRWRACLPNPAIPAQRKRAVVEQLLARRRPVSPIVRKLAADAGRTRSAGAAARARDRLRSAADGERAGRSRASSPPRSSCRRTGSRRCSRGWRARPAARCSSKPASIASIIGGAVARIGSTVYDGSVTTQLQKVKERLVAAAAE